MRKVSEILKKAREEKKLTVEDIHNITKIRTKYLEAIEKADWDALPGLAYIRGFIKAYADAVGLDGAKILILFRREFDANEKIEVLPKSIRDEEKKNFLLTLKKIISKIFSI